MKSFPNPTALRIGMQGTLDGRRHTVMGRVVLGMELDGETYYWSEFNVADDEGRQLTLVFEETENGPTWKLFKLFEPDSPMSATEAARHEERERFTFDGMSLHVTLVGTSRVCFIEGDAPVGTELGDVANYFNAEASDRTIVVSWTGNEVEFYEGHDLPAGRIESAFNLPAPAPNFSSFNSANATGRSMDWVSGFSWKWTCFAIVAIFLILSRTSCNGPRPAAWVPPPKQAAPAARLTLGAHGRLAARNYTVTGHALVEVARMGQVFGRQEYALRDESGGRALLVNGIDGELAEWNLLTPINPPAGFTPYEAAALRERGFVSIAGRSTQVTRLFQARVLSREGDERAVLWPPSVHYGLLGQLGGDWLLARWTETELQVYGGKSLPEREVLAGFTIK